MITSAQTALVRYGVIPEVAKFRVTSPELPRRAARVVVETHRGLQIGACLQVINGADSEIESTILRSATSEDEQRGQQLRDKCRQEFNKWVQRIADWGLALELLDLEYTLDESKLILYVLNERGPDCTRLAIQAAAAGLGVVEVQPVNRDGLVQLESQGGGCGSGGGGCGSGGCSH